VLGYSRERVCTKRKHKNQLSQLSGKKVSNSLKVDQKLLPNEEISKGLRKKETSWTENIQIGYLFHFTSPSIFLDPVLMDGFSSSQENQVD
jgi:hypothetical protein